jgi:mRNA interferase RelE/StbE
MAYSILLRPAAVRDLKSLPSGVRSRIEKAIGRLVSDARTSGTRKLAGFDDEWRLRVGD